MKTSTILLLSLAPLLAYGLVPLKRGDPSRYAVVQNADGSMSEVDEWTGHEVSHNGTPDAAAAAPAANNSPSPPAPPSSSVFVSPPEVKSTPQPSLTPTPTPSPPGPKNGNPSPTPAPYSAPPLTSATLKPGEPVAQAAVDPTPAPAGGCAASGNGVMTWRIQNNYGIPLSVSYLNNADSPSAIGCPGAGALAASATSDVVFPSGWGGRVIVGKEAMVGASLIEGSTTGWNDVDVSYVDGFSVPITCSNDKEVLTGCNIDLWKTGTCPSTEGDGTICHNPSTVSPDGPAPEFFKPCQGAAYTFANDNVANIGNTNAKVVTCCIGTEAQGCKAPARQGKGNGRPSKREIDGEKQVVAMTNMHRHAMRHFHHAKARAMKATL